MQPLRDPATVRKLIQILERQLAAHRVAREPSLEWALKEANLLDSLLMARMQLKLLGSGG
ncbi:MAG TPA: hypothetical protein VLE43_14135 [Candidatus Saccharimonadia bacterium]|nr:hypothetical protein [Candidatus Saccharimonadia bacterium]